MSLLERIVADRRERQPRGMTRPMLEEMLAECEPLRKVRSLSAALAARPAIIAEIKRCSPSRSEFPGFRRPRDLALAYAEAGAAAISMLTNEKFFGMLRVELSEVSSAVDIPVLRKEFIISEYDVLESRLLGADAVLLIARLLNDAELATLAGMAQQIGMEVLLEVHDAAELELALRVEPDIIGVNARNLDSLEMDIDAALKLATKVPPGIIVVAESGIGNTDDMARFREQGVDSFLIGTELLLHARPELRLAELLGQGGENAAH